MNAYKKSHSFLAYWHANVVCLSGHLSATLCMCIVAQRYILRQKCPNIVCLQNPSGCSISGSLVRVQNGVPLKSAALFGRTHRTCLRPALHVIQNSHF